MAATSMRALTSVKRLTFVEQSQLKIEATVLGLNESTYKMGCPHCGEDTSFSVTRRHDGILYNCYRMKCGVQGFIPMVGYNMGKGDRINHNVSGHAIKGNTVPSRKAETNAFNGEVTQLPKKVKQFLFKNYELVTEDISRQGWKYEESTNRLAMPLYSFMGYRFGWQLKKLPESTYSGPKAITYIDRYDGCGLAFANSKSGEVLDSKTVVVVEDIISATKMATLLPSCALLGTSMTDRQAGFLSTHFDTLVLMLDPDAHDKSLKISEKYRGLFNTFRVMAMSKDPKDTQFDILETIALEA
jgi:predicted RNA-binding Zn-ribbon protein involved in translation (DUF1610 family)